MIFYVLSQIDYLAVLLGTVAGMTVGGIWYMPDVFGKIWQKDLGRNPWDMARPARVIVVRAAMTLVSAFSLTVLMTAGGVNTVAGALRLGLVVGIGVVGATMASDYYSARWPVRLLMVTGGHRIVQILMMCLVMESWHVAFG